MLALVSFIEQRNDGNTFSLRQFVQMYRISSKTTEKTCSQVTKCVLYSTENKLLGPHRNNNNDQHFVTCMCYYAVLHDYIVVTDGGDSRLK